MHNRVKPVLVKHQEIWCFMHINNKEISTYENRFKIQSYVHHRINEEYTKASPNRPIIRTINADQNSKIYAFPNIQISIFSNTVHMQASSNHQRIRELSNLSSKLENLYSSPSDRNN